MEHASRRPSTPLAALSSSAVSLRIPPSSSAELRDGELRLGLALTAGFLERNSSLRSLATDVRLAPDADASATCAPDSFSTLLAVRIPVVRLDRDLPLPTTAREHDAGVDLYAREPATLKAGGGRATVPTGIAIAIPEGYGGFVQPRSGLAARHGVTMVNAPGLVDPGYRGEVHIVLINTDPTDDFDVQRGDRIGQLVVQRVETIEFESVEELPPSQRGAGGLGHSGR